MPEALAPLEQRRRGLAQRGGRERRGGALGGVEAGREAQLRAELLEGLAAENQSLPHWYVLGGDPVFFCATS